MLISMLELEELAKWMLSASLMSPLLRQGPYMSWSQDLECVLLLVLSSVLRAWRSFQQLTMAIVISRCCWLTWREASAHATGVNSQAR